MRCDFFRRLDSLDRILEEDTSNLSYARDILPLLQEPASLNYFFDRPFEIQWIEFLNDSDVFTSEHSYDFVPPHLEEKKLAWFPGKALLRSLEDRTDLSLERLIVDILIHVPLSLIPKYGVLCTLVESTKFLNNSQILFQIYPTILSRLQQTDVVGRELQKDIIEVVFELLDQDKRSDAKKLSRELYAVMKSDMPSSEQTDNLLYSSSRSKIVTRMSDWEYEHSLNTLIEKTIDRYPLWIVELIVELLQGALVAYSADSSSIIYRSSIERDDFEYSSDFRTSLIDLCIETANTVLMKTKSANILGLFDKMNDEVFLRLSLYLRSQYPNVDKSRSCKMLTDSTIIKHIDIWGECRVFVKELFDVVGMKTRRGYLERVARGPDYNKDRNGTTTHDRAIDEENRAVDQNDYKLWKYSRYSLVREHLFGKWLEEYYEFRKELGDVDFWDLDSWHIETRRGPISPLDREALLSKKVIELASYLKSWIPLSEGPMQPSADGLANLLAEVVRENPGKFLHSICAFLNVPPIYIASLLRGLKTAASKYSNDYWSTLIAYFTQLLSIHKQDIPEVDGMGENRHYWRWTKKRILEILSTGLSENDGPIPLKLSNDVWQIIDELLDDQDPEDNYRDEGEQRESPHISAINSVRGAALRAAIQYGIWKKSLANCDSSRPILDDCPKLKRRLVHHLDLRSERSIAVHSVYGNMFPWLISLSRQWAQKYKDKIFPLDGRKRVLFDAAWTAYISYRRLYTPSMEVLRPEYEFMLERLCEQEEEVKRQDKGLIEHVVIAYLRGDLELVDEPDMYKNLFKAKNQEVNKCTLDFLVTVMSNPKSEITDCIKERARLLIQWRIDRAEHSDYQSIIDLEMEVIEKCFEREVFSDPIAIKMLDRSYRLRTSIRASYSVLQKLKQLVGQYPREVIGIIRLMAEKNEWGMFGYHDDLVEIMDNCCLAQEDSLVYNETLNYLGSLGMVRLRHLETKM